MTVNYGSRDKDTLLFVLKANIMGTVGESSSSLGQRTRILVHAGVDFGPGIIWFQFNLTASPTEIGVLCWKLDLLGLLRIL